MTSDIEDNAPADILQWNRPIIYRLFMKVAADLTINIEDNNKQDKNNNTEPQPRQKR